jgi:hypothetical protein
MGLPEVIHSMAVRKIRRCQCGAQIGPKKRYCPLCRRAQRRTSWQRRSTRSQKPTVSEFTPPADQGLTEAPSRPRVNC